jgi:peptidoglycan lytic transglycosylase
MKGFLCLAVAISIVLSGCGGKKRVHPPTAAKLGSSQTGIASWYGYPYHGRRAADGEIYDMEKMTAAHRTLPFGTWLRVKNLDNGKTVDVRITDRGPFVRGRILDLSHAAAMSIAMVGPGTAKVKITVIAASAAFVQTPPAPVAVASAPVPAAAPSPIVAVPAVVQPPLPAAPALFAVQIGAFSDRGKAERIAAAMESRYGSAKLVMRDGSPPLWRVLVGREPTEEDAEALAVKIRADAEAQAANAFVVRLDDEPPANRL